MIENKTLQLKHVSNNKYAYVYFTFKKKIKRNQLNYYLFIFLIMKLNKTLIEFRPLGRLLRIQ